MRNYNIDKIITEELTKVQVDDMIKGHIRDNNTSEDLKKVVKKIISDAFSNFTRSLWTKKSFWQSEVER
jgi:hypothetical protein